MKDPRTLATIGLSIVDMGKLCRHDGDLPEDTHEQLKKIIMDGLGYGTPMEEVRRFFVMVEDAASLDILRDKCKALEIGGDEELFVAIDEEGLIKLNDERLAVEAEEKENPKPPRVNPLDPSTW